jgi:DNA-directed RNA polymerase specialized sigma subunit
VKDSYSVVAKRWTNGWELHVEGEGVTQVRTLADAEDQVRDYLETLHEASASAAQVVVFVDLDGYEREVYAARIASAEAQEALRDAAERSRKVAWALRHEKGMSVTDTAAVMGISRGRVSQLLAS